MPTPAYSVRVAPEHRDLIKRVADLLAAGRARDLRRLLDDLDAAPVGPFRSVAAYTEHVLRGLVLQLDPEEVWLFGSRARNQARTDSDYDIAVIVRDLSDRRHVRRILSGLAYDHILSSFFIRPIPLPSDYLEPRGRRPTELAEDIIRDGVEIP